MATSDQAVREAGLILRWMEKNPSERALILWMAEHDEAKRLHGDDWLEFTPCATASPEMTSLLGENEERIHRWLKLARFGVCGGHGRMCFCPVVVYPNGLMLEWPTLQLHSHTDFAYGNNFTDMPPGWRERDKRPPPPEPTDTPYRPVDQRQSQRPQNARSGGSNPPRPTTPHPRRTGV